MNKRLWPLELSAIMTFGVLAVFTLSVSITWKERSRLIAENQQLREEVAYYMELNKYLGSVATETQHPACPCYDTLASSR